MCYCQELIYSRSLTRYRLLHPKPMEFGGFYMRELMQLHNLSALYVSLTRPMLVEHAACLSLFSQSVAGL